jgi:hypothetical protein
VERFGGRLRESVRDFDGRPEKLLRGLARPAILDARVHPLPRPAAPAWPASRAPRQIVRLQPGFVHIGVLQ